MAAPIPTPKLQEREIAIEKMLQSCSKDAKLGAELLSNPKGFAAKHGVALNAQEEAQLKRVGQLVNTITGFKAAQGENTGPIFDQAETLWELVLQTTHFPPPIRWPRPKGYPIGPMVKFAHDLEERYLELSQHETGPVIGR